MTRRANDVLDPEARQMIRGRLDRIGDRLIFRIPDRLESPNEWQGHHWRIKHRITVRWEARVRRLIADAADLTSLAAFGETPGAALGLEACRVRMRVVLERHCPSARNFVRDEDNQRFLTKPVNDALKRLKLIYQDSKPWLEQPMPLQQVSADGRWWTVITIEPAVGTLSLTAGNPVRTASA